MCRNMKISSISMSIPLPIEAGWKRSYKKESAQADIGAGFAGIH
jgi:hypothetical protein